MIFFSGGFVQIDYNVTVANYVLGIAEASGITRPAKQNR